MSTEFPDDSDAGKACSSSISGPEVGVPQTSSPEVAAELEPSPSSGDSSPVATDTSTEGRKYLQVGRTLPVHHTRTKQIKKTNTTKNKSRMFGRPVATR